MRRLANITVLVILILGSAICRAENVVVTHDFGELRDADKLHFSANAANVTNGVCSVDDDGVIYTCLAAGTPTNATKNSTKFWQGTIANPLPLSICLPTYDCEVTTTQFHNLDSLVILHYPEGTSCTNIKIKLSTDGETWSSALTPPAVDYASGTIYARFPVGNYYVKICNTTSTSVSIPEIVFVSKPDCTNCLIYTP